MPESELSLPQRRPPTSADVARESGVSRATVSYVLNDTPGARVSLRTRELVLATAERLGHVPSANARSLRLGRSQVVVALVRSFVGAGFIRHVTLEALDEALVAHGYILVVHQFSPDLQPLPQIWKMISPAVVVSMGGLSVPDQAALEDSRIRLVSAHGLVPHFDAGYLQVRYLYQQGHRSIGYAHASPPTAQLVADERLRGAQAAALDLRLPELDVKIVNIMNRNSFTTALSAWRNRSSTTALCAHNDDIAAMLMLEAQRMNIRVPDDLAIIGVDDSPLAAFGITSVRIDSTSYSAAIVERVLAAVGGEEDDVAPLNGSNLLSVVRRNSA